MITTLRKHGNAYALVIDQSLLDLLDIKPDTQIELRSEGRSLVCTPVSDVPQDRAFYNATDMVHQRFGNAMRNLAQ